MVVKRADGRLGGLHTSLGKDGRQLAEGETKRNRGEDERMIGKKRTKKVTMAP
jgi:hypothetical protein